MIGASARHVTTNPVTINGTLDALMCGQQLTEPHINHFVRGVVDGSIAPVQRGAFLAAVRIQGMSPVETGWLTQAMAASGDVLDLSGVRKPLADKHSSGGQSDLTSAVIAPVLACHGLAVPMMSGRGLGPTGGTLDALESIPNFNVGLTIEEVVSQLNSTGAAIFASSTNVAPADAILYADRDVTATVANISLIAASIMSKKIAEGLGREGFNDSLVLNVTTGSGAFMSKEAEAIQLAEAMVDIAIRSGINTSAVVSSMDQPLGPLVGRSLEIQQAVRVLRGETEGFERYYQVVVELATNLLIQSGLYSAAQFDEAQASVKDKISSGQALEKFMEIVAAQGGDVSAIRDLNKLPTAATKVVVRATSSGFVNAIASAQIGWAVVYLGGGRESPGAPIDHGVGVHVHKFLGDRVEKGDPLATLHVNDDARLADSIAAIQGAYQLGGEPTEHGPLIIEVIRGN